MYVLQSEIIIQAPHSVLWGIICDFKKYPAWNPFTLRAIGTAEINSRVILHVAFSEHRPMPSPHRITKLIPELALSWEQLSPPKCLVHGIRHQTLEPMASEQTRYRNRFELSGPAAPLTHQLLGKRIAQGFQNVEHALKRYAESSYQKPTFPS